MANKATITESLKKAKDVYGLSKQEYSDMIDAYSDAINVSYDRQRDESARTYARNYAQADTNALSRGMGRSSYAMQTLANINKEKADAASSIWDRQSEDIMKYASSLQQFMKEYELKQRELDLQQQQLNLQKSAAGGGGGRRGTGNGNGNGNGGDDKGDSLGSVNDLIATYKNGSTVKKAKNDVRSNWSLLAKLGY